MLSMKPGLPLQGRPSQRARVARAVERRRRGDQAGQGEEDRAQPVEAEGETSRGGEEVRRSEGKDGARHAHAGREPEPRRGADYGGDGGRPARERAAAENEGSRRAPVA